MAEENVKVAVRMRPFNSREKARDATLIVDMKGPTTYIKDPENPNEDPKSFSFDFSYWSHDGSKDDGSGYYVADPSHPNASKFADQRKVYDNLGQGVLNNAWEGFNSTLFAYGQTGSGKSYSMVGYGVNKGIIPIFCDELFKGVNAKKDEGVQAEYEVTLSMLEIYNEQVRDLLNPSGNKKGGLKVRQHPQKGFYAEGLKSEAVGSYVEIEGKMDEGTRNRTVAATNMNATSSRAHTIVGIKFVQKAKNAAGEETAKSAVINLVDLAGSERAESTGATGDRLKEGAAINQSLSSLGNVISALADQSAGKKVKVPYRDSTLTKLLKNALGGNSKTIMIAAVSPADINYEESLSTLRYADRAKQIKTKATVNEDPTEKLIRNLQEENEKLKKMLETGVITVDMDPNDTEGMSDAEKAELKKEMQDDYEASLRENDEKMEEMKCAFEEKLRQARAETATSGLVEQNEKKKTVAHMFNLNVDPMLTGKVIHFIDGQKKVGNNKGSPCEIVMLGPSIQQEHAVLTTEGDKCFLEKQAGNAKVLVNGEPLTEKVEIHHNDRLMFGTTQLYIFANPKERDASKEKYEEITYDMAQEEIASNSGFDMQKGNKSRDDMLLQEDLLEILPAVEEANSISEELNKKKKFEVVLVSPEARGELQGRMQIFVKMTDLETDNNWTWTKERFTNRKYVMQEMYEAHMDGEQSTLKDDQDPFIEDPDAEVHIGSVKVWLQSIAYRIELAEQLEITDYKGQEVGVVNLEIIPCSGKGKDYTEKDDMWVDDPNDMLGKDLHFNVKLESARGIPNRYTDTFAKYKVYLDGDYSETKKIANTSNPDWKHKKQYDFKPVTSQLLDYLQNSAIMIQIWGKQKMPKAKKAVANTKDALTKQALTKGSASLGNTNTKIVDANKVRFSMQLAVAKKRAEKSENKVAQFRELVRLAEEYKKPRISTKLIKDLLHAPTKDAADKCLKMVPKEKGADETNGSDASHPQSATPPSAKAEPTNAPTNQKKDDGGSSGGSGSKTCVLL